MAENVLSADTFNDKANGLLGRDTPTSLFLETRWGIHTFGMKFPIDCVILDDKFEVRFVREDMKPGRFFFWQPTCKRVLELPAGTVSNTGTKIGDILEMR